MKIMHLRIEEVVVPLSLYFEFIEEWYMFSGSQARYRFRGGHRPEWKSKQ